MAYKGYYLKFGNAQLDNSLLVEESYECKPNQKIIIDKFSDVDRTMHVDVSKNRNTELSFTTKDYLTTAQKSSLMDTISQGLINAVMDMYHVEFFNPKTDAYEEMDCFMDDLEFTVLMELDSGPVYKELKVTLKQNRG